MAWNFSLVVITKEPFTALSNHLDQSDCNRLGAIYFAVPDDNVKLSLLLESPVLQRVGVSDRFKCDDFGSPMSVDSEGKYICLWAE